MNVLCVGYRDWALAIYEEVRRLSSHTFTIVRSREEYDTLNLSAINPDIILFYGWSWIIRDEVFEKYKSIMLHPSPLPKYRGGSPIQNQIINGEETSSVTLFVIDRGLDTGDIVGQAEISLVGHLNDIFCRIIEKGVDLTVTLLNGDCIGVKQDHSQATVYKRRKPEESEITITELLTQPGEYLLNKIRMLEDPYPNAFLKTIDGKKIFIKLAEMSED